MISIEKPYIFGAVCGSCGSDENILSAHVSYKQGAGGISMLLCRACRHELSEKLKISTEENDE